ncbi:MAG TPA: hypothetical protein VJX71_06530 [Methylomirabilota bacterium]|nr:hypothetical protein [Methylomirabilota bacterium]
MRNWVVISAGLMLAACKGSEKSTGPSGGPTPTGSFKGTLVGANVSAVLTVTFPGSTASAPARRVRFSIVPVANAAAAPISVTGTLAIIGDGSVTLDGTYDASANPQLTVVGGGYTITGNYTATNGVFSGSFSGPGGTSGQWTVSAGGGTTVSVYCGTYGGSGSGTWNMVLDASNRLTGVVNTAKGARLMQGSYSPGSNPNVSVTFSGGSANGNIDPSTGDGSGSWSANGGQGGSWTGSTALCSPPPASAKLFGDRAIDPNNVLAVGEAGTILFYDGTSWTFRASGTTNTLYAPGPDGFEVGAAGTILQYNPTTDSWSPQTSGTTNALYGVARTPPGGTIVVVGAAGTILHYDGTNWIPQSSGTTATLYSVAKVPLVAANFAVGAGGTILYYDGTSWSSQTSGTANDLFFVGIVSGTNVYAVGAGGTILHYDGTKWTAQTSGTTQALRGGSGTALNDLWAVGDGGTILHSSDGSTWSPQVSGTTNDLTSVSAVTANDVFAVGDKGLILHYDGTTWTRQR